MTLYFSHFSLGFSTRLFHCLIITLFVTLFSACSTVKVTQRSTVNIMNTKRASILTQAQLSVASAHVLSITNQRGDQCLANLSTCITKLKQAPQLSTLQLHATLSELYLASAKRLESQLNCPKKTQKSTTHDIAAADAHVSDSESHDTIDIAACAELYELALTESIRFSYAYLFLDEQSAQIRAFSDRQVQVRDFYNLASTKLINSFFKRRQNPEKQMNFQVGDVTFNAYIAPASSTRLVHNPVVDLISTYHLSFSGLHTQSKREGFGVNYIAVFDDKASDSVSTLLFSDSPKQAKSQANTLTQRIHEADFVPITLIIEPSGKSTSEVLNTKTFSLHVLDPYKLDKVQIQDQHYSLSANYSAPYGVWLANNNYGRKQYISLLAGLEKLQKPQLFMLEPYDPNKRVIVMMHGLASSPETWVNLTNDLLGDDVLRQNFQVWQVFYSTNLPMLENRLDIYALLKTAFAKVDRQGKDKASKHSVLIGHSMGSVIGRLLLSDTDLRSKALAGLSPERKKTLNNTRSFQRRFDLQPLAQFDRAILMAAPFKGTPFADRWYTKALRRVIQLPSAFVGEINNSLKRLGNQKNAAQLAGLKSLFLDTGADQLSDTSEFVRVTSDVTMMPNVTYHTIMGRTNPKAPLKATTDGIVPYTSAHIAGAASEKIIDGDHSIHSTPEAVLELRAILRQHLHEVDGIALPETTVSSQTIDIAKKITQAIEPNSETQGTSTERTDTHTESHTSE